MAAFGEVFQSLWRNQIDFGGTITSDKDQYMYFLACIDRFSMYCTIDAFDKANRPNVVKMRDKYIQIHKVPRNFRLDETSYLIWNKVKYFCKHNTIKFFLQLLQMITEQLD